MKTKNIFKALALAMLMPAMMLTTACSNEDDAINNGDNKKGYPLQVTVNVTRQGDKATTRATYNESTRKLEFSTGDKLFVKGKDTSVGGAGSFAGMLDYVSEGTFSGTIYTQNEYSSTADALFTAANSDRVEALLFPNGYESYGFLSLWGSGYSTSYIISLNNAIAATKAAAVEQISLETAETYSSGFALSPENAILNFTITGLTDGAKDVTLKHGSTPMFVGSVTPTSGTATFALGVGIEDLSFSPVNLKNVILTIGGTDIDITDANNNLAKGKIYNITRSAGLSGSAYWYIGVVEPTDPESATENTGNNKWTQLSSKPEFITISGGPQMPPEVWYIAIPHSYNFQAYDSTGACPDEAAYTKSTITICGIEYDLFTGANKAIAVNAIFKP